MYAATRKHNAAAEAARELFGAPDYVSDRYISKDQFRRFLRESVELKNYKAAMADEGLFRQDQNYKNVRATVGDTWRYLPFVLAWTNTETQMTISHPELLPYGMHVFDHEREHCIDPCASEHVTDLNAANPSRAYRRSDIRVTY